MFDLSTPSREFNELIKKTRKLIVDFQKIRAVKTKNPGFFNKDQLTSEQMLQILTQILDFLCVPEGEERTNLERTTRQDKSWFTTERRDKKLNSLNQSALARIYKDSQPSLIPNVEKIKQLCFKTLLALE